MKKQISTTAIALLFSLTTSSLFAQESKETPGATFLEIMTNARSASLGGMNSTTQPSAFGIFGNAAATVYSKQKSGIGASLSARKDFSDGNLYTVGGYHQLGSKSALSAGFRYFSNPEVTLNNKTYKPSEMALEVAYSYELMKNFSAAITFRYINSDLEEIGIGKANSVGGDLAVYYKNDISSFAGAKWDVGVRLANIGSKLKYDDNNKYSLPTRLGAGGSAFLPFAENHTLYLSANVDYRMVPSDFTSFEGGFGAEYNLYKYAFLRAGYHVGDKATGFGNFATLGAGVSVKGVKLDISYWLGAPDKEYKNITCISLSLDF